MVDFKFSDGFSFEFFTKRVNITLPLKILTELAQRRLSMLGFKNVVEKKILFMLAPPTRFYKKLVH